MFSAARKVKAMVSAKRGFSKAKTYKKPKVAEFLGKADYRGAITLIDFNRRGDEEEDTETSLRWLAYCAFHLGDFARAEEALTRVLEMEHRGSEVSKVAEEDAEADGMSDEHTLHLYRAICLYYMQRYAEANELAESLAPQTPLLTRLLFHLSHKLGDEPRLRLLHSKLGEDDAAQLSLAAIHYLRGHFQPASDIYKRVLLGGKENTALNIYVAMCYYRLDYFDVSNEVLKNYLDSHPDSIVSVNLKACNQYRLYNGKMAEAEYRALTEQGINLVDSPLVRHNQVVFRNGEEALTVLPKLLNIIPEALLNLVIYSLRNGDTEKAFELMRDWQPTTPEDYILKGVVFAMMGQESGKADLLRTASNYFQAVGTSTHECDTVPGRQCMASCYFLLGNFADVNIYLQSIKPYCLDSEVFHWNYGMSLCATGDFVLAEEHLQQVTTAEFRNDFAFISCLARAYVMNKKEDAAWELYVNYNNHPEETYKLLLQIANDCYVMGAFYYAAKSFDVLERIDPEETSYWEGKRGACIGVFQLVVAKRETKLERLWEVVSILRKTKENVPQTMYIIGLIRKWATSQGLDMGVEFD